MQKLRFIIFSLCAFFSVSVNAQFTVNGRIIDSATREPMVGASVFCQNTTIGTATNKQGEFTLNLKSGGYDLIITSTGYQVKDIKISHTDSRIPDIEMIKQDKTLGEVIITSSNEVKDGWEKYGSFFMDHFIGTTPNAARFKLENPEVLKFYFLKRSNKLRVLATEPLLMENAALGYNMRYQLDSFVYHYNTDINSYSGYCLYTEMQGDDSLQRSWARNRRNAYFGSKLQFMRSYYDSTVREDGFVIDVLDENDDTKFNGIDNIYDSTYFGALDSTGQIEVWFPRKIRITYTGARPDPQFLKKFKLPKDVLLQITYVDPKNSIAIMENGYFYDQRDWINQGYWSWKNIADMLPYDYLP
jgi:hypothetical protein